MAIIEVENLGKVQIAGSTPTEKEQEAIYNQLQSLDSEDVFDYETEAYGATDTIIPELIDPNLTNQNKDIKRIIICFSMDKASWKFDDQNILLAF